MNYKGNTAVKRTHIKLRNIIISLCFLRAASLEHGDCEGWCAVEPISFPRKVGCVPSVAGKFAISISCQPSPEISSPKEPHPAQGHIHCSGQPVSNFYKVNAPTMAHFKPKSCQWMHTCNVSSLELVGASSGTPLCLLEVKRRQGQSTISAPELPGARWVLRLPVSRSFLSLH